MVLGLGVLSYGFSAKRDKVMVLGQSTAGIKCQAGYSDRFGIKYRKDKVPTDHFIPGALCPGLKLLGTSVCSLYIKK